VQCRQRHQIVINSRHYPRDVLTEMNIKRSRGPKSPQNFIAMLQATVLSANRPDGLLYLLRDYQKINRSTSGEELIVPIAMKVLSSKL
jgi:hypothetical protein